MRETLEDLYYGNIKPYDRQIRSGTSLMKAMEQSQECEEQLTKLLEGEAHSLLLRLINEGTRSATRWLWRISSWVSIWERV